MLSKRYFINNKLNNLLWELGDLLGNGFESHIVEVIKKQLLPYYDRGVSLTSTSRTRDDGKDIVISSKIDLLDIIENNFYIGNLDTMKIYIECKSSNKGPISFNDITGNIDRISKDKINYFVLITNTTIMPYTYYILENKCKRLNIKFMLVDQYILYKYLKKQKSMIGNINIYTNITNIYSEYQILSYENNNKNKCEIFLLLRNYKCTTEKIDINLISNRNWKIDNDLSFYVLLPNQGTCINLNVSKQFNDGSDDLSFLIKTKSSEHVIDITGVNLSNSFNPAFVGKQHIEIVRELYQLIQSDSYIIRYIIGEAGTGKTRIIDELEKETSGKNISVLRISCTKNETLLKNKISSFLIKEGFINEISKINDLYEILNSIKSSYKKCLIIFDDFHNLTEQLDTIKKLFFNTMSKNLKIIFVGRNDYSVENLKYFNFLSLCENKKAQIKGYILRCMDDNDASDFIRNIIPDIPEIVFLRIKKMSNNNPLFIIQFIEYLLEINLAEVVNRSLICICNIDKFSSLTYIPGKIEDLYKKRFSNLSINSEYDECLEFMYIFAMLGIQISKDKIICFFENNQEKLDILIKRKFIKFNNDSTINIFHESIYLYLNKLISKKPSLRKKIAKKIISKPYLMENLSDFDCGQINFYAGNNKEAEKKFVPIIDFCRNINNYTAININIEYYEYLESVFKLVENRKDFELLCNILICKIYTALHYFTPIKAIDECEEAERKIKIKQELNSNNKLITNILTLKAHSCVNAGRLKQAQNIYIKLLSQYMVDNQCLDKKSNFDMYDRLSGLYLRYNKSSAAENFNLAATCIAQELDSKVLLGLTEITKAKLSLYSDFTKSYSHLENARDYLIKSGVKRNISHNNITIAAYTIMKNKKNSIVLSKIKNNLIDYLDEAIQNFYPSSIIRCYLLLAISDFCINDDNFFKSSAWIQKGIDSSIHHGILTYIWMFYNLKFIIATKLDKEPHDIAVIAEIIFKILKQQNLLQSVETNLTYSNILVFTNILRFYSKHSFEKTFYNKISQMNLSERNSTCDFNCGKDECLYSCANDIGLFRKQYHRIKTGKLLFTDNYSYDFIDEETGYYIVFA